MTKTCDWIGGSGTKYTYHIHELPISFKKNDGNYIYSKLNANSNWVPIYIGEGDLSERIGDRHHQATCIRNKGATHVHEHLNSTKNARKIEEQDLLQNYTNAYQPNGCNEKEGG